MAEGDGAQNQGIPQQSGGTQEVKSEPLDQKKLDRAAKERERRRRRRRKKAELKRLERETLQQQGAVPKPEVPQPAKPEVPPSAQPAEKIEPGLSVKKEEPLQKQPRPRRKKVTLAPEGHRRVQQPPSERPIVQRSEEHAPRSKDIVPQAEPKEKELQKPVQKQEKSAEDIHPLSHKTHSFAGPLIEPSAEQPKAEQKQKAEEPVQPEPAPEVKPEPAPEIQPRPQPELPQQAEEDENQQVNLEDMPPIFPDEENIEPGGESSQQSQPEPAPEKIQPEPEPEVQPQPEPKAEVIQSAPQPEPEPSQPSAVESAPHAEEEDIVIHNEHEEVRPSVGMHEVGPGAFPYPQHPEEEQKIIEAEPVEEIKPEKKSPKKVEREKNVREQQESGKETLTESEGLNERKSLLQAAGAFSAGVFKNVGTALHNFRLKFDFRKLIWFVVLMVIGGGLYAGYLFKVHEKVYTYVAEFFKAPPPVEVHIDDQLLREWGIATAYLFGDNRGSTKDLLVSQLYNAYYFGYLSEPRVQGETGITPAYFYGKGEDLVVETNRFIGYIKNLRELVSVYDVDVYKMLDQTTEREKSLDSHVAKLKEIQEKSNGMLKEIRTEIDDLKVSFESLNPEKARSESDFFTALQGLAGEKSDFLLKSFIDVSQKQTALKAHLAALEKLAGYYDSSLAKLAIRITAIEKNYQALAQGIRVVDIPGANLDIIIKETP